MGLAKKSDLTNQEPSYFWFVVNSQSKVSGPFSETEVLALVARNEIGYKDYCWRSGFREWRPLISTPDFRPHFKGQSQQEPLYPNVEIPNARERGVSIYSGSAHQQQERRKVVVTFAKTKIKRMSVYEWAFAALFAIFLAYFSSTWVIGELTDRVQGLAQRSRLGAPQRFGNLYEAVFPSVAIDPLYSAPESDVVLKAFPLPVRLRGHAEDKNGQVLLKGVQVKSPLTFRLWNPSMYSMESIYRKPLHVSGYLQINKQNIDLLVSHPGSPLLFK